MYEGDILYFVDGAATTPIILDAPSAGQDYVFTFGTPKVVNIKRTTVAVAATATTTSYLTPSICVKSANLVPSPTTLDNSTVCTGKINTSVTVSTEYKLDMQLLVTNDVSFGLLKRLSDNLATVHFAISFDGQILEIGTAQLNAMAVSGAEVKNQLMGAISANVQGFTSRYGVATSLTTAQITLEDTDRKLWGLELTGVKPA